MLGAVRGEAHAGRGVRDAPPPAATGAPCFSPGGAAENSPGRAPGATGAGRTARASEVPGHVAAGAGGQGAPGGQGDAVAHEAHGAVGQQEVDPAGVVTAGGGERLVVAGVAAVPLAGLVWGVVVVV